MLNEVLEFVGNVFTIALGVGIAEAGLAFVVVARQKRYRKKKLRKLQEFESKLTGKLSDPKLTEEQVEEAAKEILKSFG